MLATLDPLPTRAVPRVRGHTATTARRTSEKQESFSWKQVGLGALGAAVSSGMGQAGMFSSLGQYGAIAANAATTNAITQGMAVAMDLQDKFNWRAVATSAMAAPVAQYLGAEVGGFVNGMVGGSAGQMAGAFAQRFTSGVVSQRIRMAVYNQGKLDYAAIAADAFGNQLGQGVVSATNPPTEAEQRAANRCLLNAMEQQADPDRYVTPPAGSGMRLGSGGPGLRLDAASVAGWGAQEDDGIRQQAQALANFDSVAQSTWAAEDAQARVQALSALAAQHARADAYRGQLARQAEDAREAQLQAYIAAVQRTGGPRGGAGPGYDAPATTVEMPQYDAMGNFTGMTTAAAAAPHVAANPLASQLLGGTLGVLDTFASGANATVRMLGNAVLQVGDILTLGVNHDSEIMRNVWAEQQALGTGLVRLATEPRTVIGGAIEGVANRYALAEALRTQGDEIGAARINAGLASEVASGVLGLGQTVGGLGKLGASGLRGLGAPDWRFVINDVPNLRGQGGAIGAGLERVGNVEAAGGAGRTGLIDFAAGGDIPSGFYSADPAQLRFTQSDASPFFSKGGTIDSLVSDLRSGKVTPDLVGDPLQVVMHDGLPFSIDNRRLVAFNLADVKDVPIQVMTLQDPVVATRFFDRFDPIAGVGQNIVITPSSGRTPAQLILRDAGLIKGVQIDH